MIKCLTHSLSNIRKPDNFHKDVEEESVKRRSKLGECTNSLNYLLETALCLELRSINYFRENKNLTSFDYDDNSYLHYGNKVGLFVDTHKKRLCPKSKASAHKYTKLIFLLTQNYFIHLPRMKM